MADFKQAFSKTLLHEGGYANIPQDKGGETYAGVARNYFPNWKGWELVDAYKPKFSTMTLKDKALLGMHVEEFYKTNFWDKALLDSIKYQYLAEEIFDSGVNFGVPRGVKFTQEACNLLNRQGKDYPEITVDGVMGSRTIQTINDHRHPLVLLKLMNVLQGEAYVNNCRKSPSQEIFLRGWLSRVELNKLK